MRQEALHGARPTGSAWRPYLRLGEGELKKQRASPSVDLTDALEPIIAAVFLDAGFRGAKGVIDRLYGRSWRRSTRPRLKDPQTALQEWLQGGACRCPNILWPMPVARPTNRNSRSSARSPASASRPAGIGVSRRAAEQDRQRASGTFAQNDPIHFHRRGLTQ